MWPQIIAGMPVRGPRQINTDTIPSTRLVTANPFRGYPEAGGEMGDARTTVGARPSRAKIACSSGIPDAVVQSVAPTGCTRVCGLTRPSAAHWLNCSRLIGPYSLPSDPMTLYILDPFSCPLSSGEEARGSSELDPAPRTW